MADGHVAKLEGVPRKAQTEARGVVASPVDIEFLTEQKSRDRQMFACAGFSFSTFS